MLLSEHVAVAFKMTEQVEWQICIKLSIKLKHSTMETIGMIQKAATIVNWWLAASSCKHACLCIMFRAEFFCKTSNHPGDSAPLQPRFRALWLLAFLKTKISFEREETSDHQSDLGKHDEASDSNWENCVRPQGAYFEGDWSIITLCTMFLVSSSVNVYF